METDLPFKPLKQDSVFVVKTRGAERRPAMESLGCHIVGFAPPHPNPWGLSTTMLGVCARVARETPGPDPELLKEFSEFVSRRIDELFPGGIPATIVDFDKWLFGRSYPEWRKDQLRRKWARCRGMLIDRHFKDKCFMKDEVYPTFKHARGIYSRSDEFKCFLGPWAELMEEIVYEHESFIKHVPVLERPGKILEKLFYPGAIYVTTDYTAFESHFTQKIMEACEFQLYDKLTRNLPGHDFFMETVRKVLGGRNECYFKHFKFSIDATRMSGEMVTSLGNGWTNLMLAEFAAYKHGTSVKGFVEGDDGIFVFDKNIIPPSSFFEKLGWTIKMETHESLNTASFCGNIFDPVDKIIITDPIEVLLNFGWSKTPYVGCKKVRLLELLKSKSLSYAYQYKGAPIIQSLAHYGLRVTRRIDLRRYLEKDRNLSLWEREQLLEAVKYQEEIERIEIPKNTRALVEQLYGISPELQERIEEYLDALDDLVPLRIPLADSLFHNDTAAYWTYFVSDPRAGFVQTLLRREDWISTYKDNIKLCGDLKRIGVDMYQLT